MSKDRHLHCGGRGGERRSFALPGAEAHFGPDRPGELLHLRLELRVDLEARRLDGIATTRFRVQRENQRSVRFNLAELSVTGVSLEGGAELTFRHEGGILEADLPEAPSVGTELAVRIDYGGHPRTGLNFVGPDQDYPDNPLQAWSQGQDEYSRYWFPAHDSPNARCPTEMIVTTAARWTTVSNGRLAETRDNTDGTRTWHWVQQLPHTAYLVSLCIGEFDHWSDSAAGVPLEFYVPPGRRADGERSLGSTGAMVEHFSAYLDEPFPFEKYAQVVAEEYTFGGMENSGATTLYDGAVYDEAAALDFRSDELVAHELAHQWFGDLITCREWAHGWLNEGFATFFEQVWLEHAFGADEAMLHRLDDRDQYLAEDGRYRRPVVERRFRVPTELFDSHLYEKGGWVLWMLRNLLGDQDFQRGLRAYIKRHRLGLVTTEDLQKSFEDTTGLGLGWFFDQWIMRPGYPEFKVSYSWDQDQSVAHLGVEQTQSTEDGTPVFRTPLEIAFGLEGGRVERRSIEVTRAHDGFDLRLPSRPLWVRFDARNQVLKTLDFKRPVELLLAQLTGDDVAGRIEAASELGRVAGPGVVDALELSLRTDSNWGVQAACARALGRVRTGAARTALLANVAHPHPRVRPSVASALGAFRGDDEVARVLRERVGADPAQRAAAAAAAALGQLRVSTSVEGLAGALERTSQNEIVRARAAEGLSATRDAAAIPLIRRIASAPWPQRLRRAALASLGGLARQLGRTDRAQVRDVLEAALHDPRLMVRVGAVQGLAALGDAAALPALEALVAREIEGAPLAGAAAAIESLRGGRSSSDEVRNLRGEVDRLKDRESDLRERLDKLERPRL
ncbi:MAG: M1 family aminopeptidase [Candidatus Dormibacteria bacterium]